MDERDEPVRHETTIIDTGGGRGGGGSTLLLLAVALIAGALCFLYFGGYIGNRAGSRDININITAPDINISPGGSGGNSTK